MPDASIARIIEVREHHRATVLAGQVDSWHDTQRLDAYLQAMQAPVADLDPPQQEAATAWLAWARQHRDRIDPLRQPLGPPPDPDFTPDVIAPFMRGCSAYGPAAY